MSGAKKTQTTGMSPTLPAVSQSDSTNRGTSLVLGFFKLSKRSYGSSIEVPNSFA